MLKWDQYLSDLKTLIFSLARKQKIRVCVLTKLFLFHVWVLIFHSDSNILASAKTLMIFSREKSALRSEKFWSVFKKMDISTNLLPSILTTAFSSTPTLCYNHLSSIHSILSVICHIILLVTRTLSSKLGNQRCQSTRNKTETSYQEDEDTNDYYPFSVRKVTDTKIISWL